MTAVETLDLAVVGLVFFEVFVPEDAEWPGPGKEAYVPAMPVRLGGAINAASIAHALGARVRLVTPRGDGLTDRAITSELARLGLPMTAWLAPPDPAITLVKTTPQDRAFLSSVAEGALEGCPALPKARWIHVGGLPDAEILAPRLAEARARGARLSVSAGWDPDRLDALAARVAGAVPCGEPLWDLFFANAREAERIAGSKEHALDRIAGCLAHDVVISDGPRGARARIGGVDVQATARSTTVVDSTGAGDALAGATVTALSLGREPRDALALGVRVAERVIQAHGGMVEPDALADLALREVRR